MSIITLQPSDQLFLWFLFVACMLATSLECYWKGFRAGRKSK